MRFLLLAGFIICVLLRPAFAQLTVFYPDAASLKTTLYALANERKSGFQNIKGALINQRGTTQYFSASTHMVPADTPKICEDTDPMQVYYSDFVAKGMSKEKSQEVFKKWQELIKSALPGCNMIVDGTQYPDLESLIFYSADGIVNFTLYRNGTGNGCQVSFSFMNRGWPVSRTTNVSNINTAQVNTVQSAEVEGVKINGEEFSRQLRQLLQYAKGGFKEIKGAKAKSEYVDKHATTFKINGALSQEIVDFPFLGVAYTAVYMENVIGTRGNTLFEQLRKIVKQSLPGGFVDEGVKDDGRMKVATYTTDGQKMIVEINKSLITNTISVVVRYKKKY